MGNYKVKLIKKWDVAEGTMAFSFEKPMDFKYEAGQYIIMSLAKYLPDEMGRAQRSMSLASAPSEDDLLVVMRMTGSEFKNKLKELDAGDEIDISGPFGHLRLHKDKKPTVFIAGGVGVAPFRSMIKEEETNGWSKKIYLFYSDKLPKNAVFLNEFEMIKNDNFVFIPTMTSSEISTDWKGERGRIGRDMLSRHIKDIKKPIYYIIGLPDMARAIRDMLIELGVSQMNIETELFTGYK